MQRAWLFILYLKTLLKLKLVGISLLEVHLGVKFLPRVLLYKGASLFENGVVSDGDDLRVSMLE